MRPQSLDIEARHGADPDKYGGMLQRKADVLAAADPARDIEKRQSAEQDQDRFERKPVFRRSDRTVDRQKIPNA